MSRVKHENEQRAGGGPLRAHVNGVELDYAVHGPTDGVPLLLVMGLGMQRIAWPPALLDALAAQGLRCITFDNRDVGLSTGYDACGVPPMPAVLGARLLRLRWRLPYQLSDIADDAAALLDHLQIDAAHVAGISMGGMIAQHLAHRHPQRVRTLTLMATSSGRLGLPLPAPRVMRLLLSRPRRRRSVDAALRYMVELFTAIGSPGYPTPRDQLEQRIRIGLQRANTGAGVSRQLAAIMADGDRTPILRLLRVPTLVLHGEADRMVPVRHGQQLQRAIADATLETIAGWGHDLPDALADTLARRIGAHVRSR